MTLDRPPARFAAEVARVPAAHAAAAAVEVLLRRARLVAVRGDLPAAVVPDHARRVGAAARARARDRRAARAADDVAELGCGSGEKLAHPRSQRRRAPFRRIQLIDISPAALDDAQRRLGRSACRRPSCTSADLRGRARRATARPRAGQPMLVLFLGSNIGNFDPPAARELLRGIRARAAPGRRAAARHRPGQARARPAAAPTTTRCR